MELVNNQHIVLGEIINDLKVNKIIYSHSHTMWRLVCHVMSERSLDGKELRQFCQSFKTFSRAGMNHACSEDERNFGCLHGQRFAFLQGLKDTDAPMSEKD